MTTPNPDNDPDVTSGLSDDAKMERTSPSRYYRGTLSLWDMPPYRAANGTREERS